MQFILAILICLNFIQTCMIILLFNYEKKSIKLNNRKIYNPFFEDYFDKEDCV